MKVLALDISKRSTGWAVDGEDGRPRAGCYRGASEHLPGKAGAVFSEWLCSMIDAHKPDLIAVEAAAFGASGSGDFRMSKEISKLLIGLAFLAETVAASYQLRYSEYAVQTVRAHFVGAGRPKNPKKAVRDRCNLLGWETRNDDEGDALALWACTKAMNDKSFRYETATPLFAPAS